MNVFSHCNATLHPRGCARARCARPAVSRRVQRAQAPRARAIDRCWSPPHPPSSSASLEAAVAAVAVAAAAAVTVAAATAAQAGGARRTNTPANTHDTPPQQHQQRKKGGEGYTGFIRHNRFGGPRCHTKKGDGVCAHACGAKVQEAERLGMGSTTQLTDVNPHTSGRGERRGRGKGTRHCTKKTRAGGGHRKGWHNAFWSACAKLAAHNAATLLLTHLTQHPCSSSLHHTVIPHRIITIIITILPSLSLPTCGASRPWPSRRRRRRRRRGAPPPAASPWAPRRRRARAPRCGAARAWAAARPWGRRARARRS